MPQVPAFVYPASREIIHRQATSLQPLKILETSKTLLLLQFNVVPGFYVAGNWVFIKSSGLCFIHLAV